MIQINEKSVFTALIFIFGIVLVILTFDMRRDVALVPRMMGTTLIVLSGIQLIIDLFPAIRRRFPSLERKRKTMFDSDDDELEGPEWKKYLFFAWMGLFTALMFYINVIWGVALSLFIYLKWIAKESWKMSILYALGFAAAIYLIFVVGLNLYYFY